jgi:hypothetical protein
MVRNSSRSFATFAAIRSALSRGFTRTVEARQVCFLAALYLAVILLVST